jgi:hypothetical protein
MVAQSQIAPHPSDIAPAPDSLAPSVPAVAPAHASRGKADGRELVKVRKLTRQEIRFCALVAEGVSLWKCYKAIAPKAKKSTCECQAWRWRARPAVANEIARLRGELTDESAMRRGEKRNILARVARNEDGSVPHGVVVRAVEVDNAMTGDDQPFRKAAGEDLRVSIFVVRLGADAPEQKDERNVTPSHGKLGCDDGAPLGEPLGPEGVDGLHTPPAL